MKQLFPIREWILYLFGLLIVWSLFHPLPTFYTEATFSFIPVTFLFGHLLSVFLMVMEVLILMYFINEYESMRLLILVRSRSCVFIGRILVRMMWPSAFLMLCIKAVLLFEIGGIHPLILGSIPILFLGMTLLAIFIQDSKKTLFLSLILAALIRLGCFYFIG
ncbi:MAG: hypothetical protein HXK75_03955 [Granulicatella sp.]|nr:hypothetical protein [Granulicatella sp.]